MFRIGTLEVSGEMVISFCAIGLTVYQAYLTRRHNRLSVRPHLVWHINRKRDQTSLHITFTLKNEGLGPALIREMYFDLEGERFEADSIDVIASFAETLFGKRFAYRVAEHGLPGIGSSMPPAGKTVVARVIFDCPSAAIDEQIEAVLSRARFQVRYETLYGETKWLN